MQSVHKLGKNWHILAKDIYNPTKNGLSESAEEKSTFGSCLVRLLKMVKETR